jgi:RND family efflux transporter MFP subunit
MKMNKTKRQNYFTMKIIKTIIVTIIATLGLFACAEEQSEGLAGKKDQLQQYKQEIKALEDKVAELESQIAAEDPDFVNANRNTTLVTTRDVINDTFEHFVEVRGSVTSRRNVTISAQTPAMVLNIAVEEGTKVRKGQLLVRQEAETLLRNIEEIKTSLELAETRFRRQSNLWDKNIGTEFQYLEAKNAKESLERKLASLNAQLDNYIIRAPFSGTVDEVFVKEGEMAQPGVPLLRLVSLSNMYIEADVSEAYLGEFEQGDSVIVTFPSLNRNVQSIISSVGQVINENNRTFKVEVRLPDDDLLLRPNLMAVVKLKDFEEEDALIVPTNLIQNDQKGDFVYIAVESAEQKGYVAQKKHIQRGKTYKDMTMVASGLQGDEQLIDEGFREVAQGVSLRFAGQDDRVAMDSKNISANQ